MVNYKPVKVTINAVGLVEVILDIVIQYHGFLDLIIIHRGLFFNSNFWLLFCYFLGIKQKLFTVFYPQTKSLTEKQNNTVEAHFYAFINCK